MSLQVIPISSLPNQSFNVQLSVDNKPLTLGVRISFNEMASYWILRISDVFDNVLIDSIPMLVGTWPAANLLQQQKYLNIGSRYVVNVSSLIAAQPSSVGYGGGSYGGEGFGGDNGMSGFDWPDNLNLGRDFQLWIDDTPVT